MPKRTSAAETQPVRFVLVTMDRHLAGAAERARRGLCRELPNLVFTQHAACDWNENPQALARCVEDIAQADLIVVTMLFMEDHYLPVIEALRARREHCDAMACLLSASEVTRLTRLGRFDMQAESRGPLAFLKRLRGARSRGQGAGEQQMKMLRRLPRLLRFIPGTAQDVRAYFLLMQYWLAGSEENIGNLVRFLVQRYVAPARREGATLGKVAEPLEYPETGLYHPRLKGRFATEGAALQTPAGKGAVGVLLMRSYLLSGNTAHYDGVIAALEAKGLRVIPAFASGLDARPAIDRFFVKQGKPVVDAVVSLTGFSLVGGPAYNDAAAAEEVLANLDVPYLACTPVEFQTLEQWETSAQGLLPVEATMMVSLPELDGGVAPMVFGGRREGAAGAEGHEMQPHEERIAALANRVEKLVALRRTANRDKRVAVVLFNFPPNAGNTGTAAHLAVFESLYNLLGALAREGYTVEQPASVDALREQILRGNAETYGTTANVLHRVPAETHVRRERWLADIERHWGPAPGRDLTDGSNLFVLGAQFGNVVVAVQPGFGYEGDPMRLLFEQGFAPTHAFAAFYSYLREDFGAHAVLHFGTHGALEFMPGKQVGLSEQCWPERLIRDLPNLYLYASNNPSEGTIAKRRSAATLVSYLTPSITRAGLYRGLADLKATVDRWRETPPDQAQERERLAEVIQAQAAAVDLADAEPLWTMHERDERVAALLASMRELEATLIPQGLHVLGQPMAREARRDLLTAMHESLVGQAPDPLALEPLLDGSEGPTASDDPTWRDLAQAARHLREDGETPALLHALQGRYIRPVTGADVLRSPSVLPTGRNLHGFDPFRIPSAHALHAGIQQAERLLARLKQDSGSLPASIALVLWGTDNLKTEGGPIGQVLALIGARPRFDGYGRLAGATLVPLAELGRPRMDVVVTLSGIFRDLLPLQTKLLAEAFHLAAAADEPLELNFIRKHALEFQASHGCDLETAALRVFGNADGAYGANVNHLIDNGRWSDGDELAELYSRRKGFAYGRSGRPVAQGELLASVLSKVEAAYQNLESVEVGVTTIDQYFDTLGGISRAVARARGDVPAVYVGDHTQGEGTVRTLSEQVALETRTRVLNPKWHEGMLQHGFEGVRQIESAVTNTMGWSATTGQVAPWVYQQITQTFVKDPAMHERLAALNLAATAKVTDRLLEAYQRNYWQPDGETLAALQRASEDLADRLEGIPTEVAA